LLVGELEINSACGFTRRMAFSFPPEYPPEIGEWYVARATLTGPLHVDVIMVQELIRGDCEAIEGREELAERMLPGEIVPPYAVIGIYKDHAGASAACSRVQAWRAGS
jgi:hypothetical protein